MFFIYLLRILSIFFFIVGIIFLFGIYQEIKKEKIKIILKELSFPLILLVFSSLISKSNNKKFFLIDLLSNNYVWITPIELKKITHKKFQIIYNNAGIKYSPNVQFIYKKLLSEELFTFLRKIKMEIKIKSLKASNGDN